MLLAAWPATPRAPRAAARGRAAAGGPAPLRARRGLVATGLYAVAILIGIVMLPRLAAFAYFVVAARAVFLPGGEGGLTLRRHITPAG